MARALRRTRLRLLCLFAVIAGTSIAAHERHTVGPYQVEIGWGEEPAFTGIRNSVAVEITGAKGAPVPDLGGASLTAEISFGGADAGGSSAKLVLPLQAGGAHANQFSAWIVPTRAGTYTFHITGKIKDQAVDVTSTCSDETFDCVVNLADIQFPVKDPSASQLVERVDRSLPRAERALDAAASARTTAWSALAVAVAALGAAVGFGMRRSGRGR